MSLQNFWLKNRHFLRKSNHSRNNTRCLKAQVFAQKYGLFYTHNNGDKEQRTDVNESLVENKSLFTQV